MGETLVMKFGGASVATPDSFRHIAGLIWRRRRFYSRCVVVVSAMGDSTNRLIELAGQVHPHPPQREYDMLVTVGERTSVALLAMALDLYGLRAISFTGSQSGIITCGRHADARIIDVRPYRLVTCLRQGGVAIVAGFQGVSLDREITTLGRGGSDTTAVALGVALGAEQVEFYKDVAGVYEEDPKLYPQASCFSQMTYEQAMVLTQRGSRVLAGRAIGLARRNGLPLRVLSFHEPDPEAARGTRIGGDTPRSTVPLYETAPTNSPSGLVGAGRL